MSAVTSSNAASGAVTGTPRRTYVTINAFNNYFYSYSVSTEFTGGQFVTTGTLDTVNGANAATCPAGRILRENGKRLYPGVNPGVTSMLVGVFDDKTFLNGFIDPNARVFQTQNNDIAPTLPDQVDADSDGTRDLGNGVYTLGDVRTHGQLDVSGSAVIHDILTVLDDAYLRGDVHNYGSTFMNAVVRIGNGCSNLTKVYVGQTTVDFGTAGANGMTTFNFDLSGSNLFDLSTDQAAITLNVPSGLESGLIYAGAYLSNTKTCNVRLYNVTGSGINVASGVYRWVLHVASRTYT
jgi:hypothetical protein